VTDWIEAYLAVIELALITAIPVLFIVTVFSWWLAWRARPYRLATIIAITNTVIGASASWLAWTVMYRSRIGAVPNEFLPITATALLALCLVPSMITAYLAWLETMRNADRNPRRRREDQDDVEGHRR
jgi:hypothetical protein